MPTLPAVAETIGMNSANAIIRSSRPMKPASTSATAQLAGHCHQQRGQTVEDAASFQGPVPRRFEAAGQPQKVFYRFLLQYVQRVVDRNRADEPAAVIDHRHEQEIVFSHRAGNLFAVRVDAHSHDVSVAKIAYPVGFGGQQQRADG